MEETESESLAPLTPEPVATLVANHRAFLAFVQKRVGDRALAEDILQDAFVRGVEKLDSVRDTAVGWFYRVLRNAIIDHHRRAAAQDRRHESWLAESTAIDAPDEELRGVVCACVSQLAGTLKPEYAAALKRIELDGVSVKDYAQEAGISSSNAGVRVFRARERPARPGRACLRYVRRPRLPRLHVRAARARTGASLISPAARPRATTISSPSRSRARSTSPPAANPDRRRASGAGRPARVTPGAQREAIVTGARFRPLARRRPPRP